MKRKLLVALALILVMISLLGTTALASGNETNWGYDFWTQCYSENGGYSHSTYYQTKTSSEALIDARINVLGTGAEAGYTNYMNAYNNSKSVYQGGKWQQPNTGVYLPIANTGLFVGDTYAPGGRGNTKYNQFLGMTTIHLGGQFRPH